MGLFSTSRVRVEFVTQSHRRQVIVRGLLSESQQRKLRRVMSSLPIRQGRIELATDRAGRTRVVFGRGIPEKYHQPVRNLLGNLGRL